MKFKTYLAKRQELMNAVNALIDEGKLDEAEAKMNEVKELDKQWDAITQARANVEALQNDQRIQNPQDMTDVAAELDAGEIKDTVNLGIVPLADTETKELYATDLYKNAWAKKMMGKPLNDKETEVMEKVNEYTHTTSNTSVVIPKTVAAGILDLAEELYPYWDDIQKTYVKGAYNAITSDESTDAKWYDEDTETEDGKEIFGELALTGCELSRSITVAWKLREMAIEDFIPFIQEKLARKMGAGLGYGATHGKGKPASNEFKPEPLGVVTALEKEKNTPQIVTYETGKLTYKNLTSARAKVKVAAKELKVYANSTTIWTELANVTDNNGKAIFIPDPVNTGIYRLFGMEVKQDDSMKDGEILMSSPNVGYLANINKEISVMAEEHVKKRTVDYCGYAVVDGGPTTNKAHALLKYGVAEATETQTEGTEQKGE